MSRVYVLEKEKGLIMNQPAPIRNDQSDWRRNGMILSKDIIALCSFSLHRQLQLWSIFRTTPNFHWRPPGRAHDTHLASSPSWCLPVHFHRHRRHASPNEPQASEENTPPCSFCFWPNRNCALPSVQGMWHQQGNERKICYMLSVSTCHSLTVRISWSLYVVPSWSLSLVQVYLIPIQIITPDVHSTRSR